METHHLIDVLVDVVVLNLAVEYHLAVISEGSTLSLLTAVLLKLTLEVAVVLNGASGRTVPWCDGPRGEVVAGALLWLVAPGSKVAVLELVNVVFGEEVSAPAGTHPDPPP